MSNLSELPETSRELKTISQCIAGRSRLLLGEQAKEAALRGQDLGNYKILAFATHGLIAGSLQGVNEPALVLTPSNDYGNKANDGLLVSHWPVISDAAVAITTGMFDAMARAKVGGAEALRRFIAGHLKRKDLGIYAHPAYWAPFFVVGDGASGI